MRSGPYRLIRHPIYTAMFGMAIGTAVVVGRLHALIGVLVLFSAYARKIPMEERSLGTAFGAEWDIYRKES